MKPKKPVFILILLGVFFSTQSMGWQVNQNLRHNVSGVVSDQGDGAILPVVNIGLKGQQ